MCVLDDLWQSSGEGQLVVTAMVRPWSSRVVYVVAVGELLSPHPLPTWTLPARVARVPFKGGEGGSSPSGDQLLEPKARTKIQPDRLGSIMVGHRYWMPPPRQFQPMFQVLSTINCYATSSR